MTTLTKWNGYGPSAWDSPSNYAGDNLSEYYAGPMKTRDSSALDESNFYTALDMLHGESDTVQVHRFGHWAVGWYEQIFVHESDAYMVAILQDIAEQLADYPLLDEEDVSLREYENAAEYWESMSLRERIEYLNEENESIFAARSETLYGLNERGAWRTEQRIEEIANY